MAKTFDFIPFDRTAHVGKNLNANFHRINRLRRKVIFIAYCQLFHCGDV